DLALCAGRDFRPRQGSVLGRMRRLLLLIPLALVLLALVPATAGSLVGVPPHGFIGLSPQGETDAEDYELMAEAGVTSVRLPLNWVGVEPLARSRFDPQWSWIDDQVRYAAENGLRVFFFVWGTPSWVSPRLGGEPISSARQRREWLRFLHAAVFRYG